MNGPINSRLRCCVPWSATSRGVVERSLQRRTLSPFNLKFSPGVRRKISEESEAIMRKSLFGIRVVATPSTRVVTTRVAAFALAFVFAAQASAAQRTTKELTVVGHLTPTVEAGGWLIVAEYGKYLILNSRAYQGEAWFREGSAVEATGEVRQDVMTAQMEGVPFQVRSMRARGRGAARDAGARDVETRNGGAQTGGAAAPPGRRAARGVLRGGAARAGPPAPALPPPPR